MAKSPSTANWQTIDPATLPAPIAKQYDRYKEAYREMKAERSAFEDAMKGLITVAQNQRVVFGYNFGKLSIALVEGEIKPVTKSGAQSLSDFLKSQATLGKRT